MSDDRKTLLTGGLRDGTLTNLENMNMVEFQISRLPGWPEYFAGFAVHKDGTVYGVTSSFRLIKISKEGKVEKEVPVY